MDIDHLGRAGRFEEVLRLLQTEQYTEESICRRFGLKRPEDFEIDRSRRAHPLPLQSPADLLTTLFLAGEAVSLETAARLLGKNQFALLEEMGLLSCDFSVGRCHATVALYPIEDVYLASDRWSCPDGAPFTASEDIVYPAFIPNTRLFLRQLPENPAGDFLDLCAGTGAAAILAAKHGAAEAWSGDIAERSTRFAEFNRRLNGLANVQAVTGDLYQGLASRRFDTIVAHPPYVPALQPKWIFFSGGHDGEEITRRMIEGVPSHLRERGVFMALTMAADRLDHPLEHRIREWLGPNNAAFDIALIVRKELDPQEFAVRAHRDTVRSRDEAEAWRCMFERLRVVSLVYGFVLIRHNEKKGEPFTVRRQAATSGLRSPWEWLFAWESVAHGGNAARIILDSRIHASPEVEFEVIHRLQGGGWIPSSYRLRTGRPFSMECVAQPWMAHLLSICNGHRTGRDLLLELKTNEVVPSGTAEDEFAKAAASLVSGGFLEVDGFRPPRAAG